MVEVDDCRGGGGDDDETERGQYELAMRGCREGFEVMSSLPVVFGDGEIKERHFD